jgi:hypothetical protein
MRFFGEAWEELIRLALQVTGNEHATDESCETIWADPESRTESEHVDAQLKQMALKVPLQQIWENIGYSPTQIERFKGMRAQDKLLEALAPVAPVTPPGQMPPPASDIMPTVA